MNAHVKGAAKRLVFSLAVAAALAGCAVYEPYPAAYQTVDPYGYPYPYSYPYSYGPSAPYYVGPPVSLGLWFESHRGGGHSGHHGFGHRGWGHGGWSGGHRGNWGGGPRGSWSGGQRGGWGGRR